MSSILRVTNLQNASGTNIFSSSISLAANGYYRFPSGAIMQWCRGSSLASETTTTVTYPIAFPTACVAIMPSTTNVAGTYRDAMFQISSFTTSSCVVFLNSFNSAGGTCWPDLLMFGY